MFLLCTFSYFLKGLLIVDMKKNHSFKKTDILANKGCCSRLQFNKRLNCQVDRRGLESSSESVSRFAGRRWEISPPRPCWGRWNVPAVPCPCAQSWLLAGTGGERRAAGAVGAASRFALRGAGPGRRVEAFPIHSFNNFSLSTNCMPGAVRCLGYSKSLLLQGLHPRR